MKNRNTNKQIQAQEEIHHEIVNALITIVHEISEMGDRKEIPYDGLTIKVGEVGINGRLFVLSVGLTTPEDFSKYMEFAEIREPIIEKTNCGLSVSKTNNGLSVSIDLN